MLKPRGTTVTPDTKNPKGPPSIQKSHKPKTAPTSRKNPNFNNPESLITSSRTIEGITKLLPEIAEFSMVSACILRSAHRIFDQTMRKANTNVAAGSSSDAAYLTQIARNP